jgi:hypothetical protein
VADSSGFSAPPSSPEGSRGSCVCAVTRRKERKYPFSPTNRVQVRRDSEGKLSAFHRAGVVEDDSGCRGRNDLETTVGFVSIHGRARSCGPPVGSQIGTATAGSPGPGLLGLEANPQPTRPCNYSNFKSTNCAAYAYTVRITKSLFLGFFYRKVPSIFAVIMNHRNGRHRYQKGMAVGYPFTKRPSPSAAQIKTARSKSHLLPPPRFSPLIRSALPRASPRVSTCSTRLSHSG